jgi:hypothetical protein
VRPPVHRGLLGLGQCGGLLVVGQLAGGDRVPALPELHHQHPDRLQLLQSLAGVGPLVRDQLRDIQAAAGGGQGGHHLAHPPPGLGHVLRQVAGGDQHPGGAHGAADGADLLLVADPAAALQGLQGALGDLGLQQIGQPAGQPALGEPRAGDHLAQHLAQGPVHHPVGQGVHALARGVPHGVGGDLEGGGEGGGDDLAQAGHVVLGHPAEEGDLVRLEGELGVPQVGDGLELGGGHVGLGDALDDVAGDQAAAEGHGHGVPHLERVAQGAGDLVGEEVPHRHGDGDVGEVALVPGGRLHQGQRRAAAGVAAGSAGPPGRLIASGFRRIARHDAVEGHDRDISGRAPLRTPPEEAPDTFRPNAPLSRAGA